jgi:hypothetical protein
MFFALCAAEAGMFLSLLGLYRAATKPDMWSFLDSTPGKLFLSSCIVTLFSIGIIVHILRRSAPKDKKRVALAISVNLVMLVLTLGSTEVLARNLSKQTAAGETFLGVLLYPKEWSQITAYYKDVLDEMVREGSFDVYDPILGWTVGPSRIDRTRSYFSSDEGLRSPRVGMSFADLKVRHSGDSKIDASVRIALIGDSMTYGHEVRCDESWGHALEGLLQPHVQVLNFAISGHGLNQTLLRYEQNVRPWKPQVVIIGVSSRMVERINNIYPFLQVEWPFASPRLVLKDDALTAISERVPDASEIFALRAITELPDLHQDDYYRPFHWKREGMWRVLESSYIFRFAYSLRPPSDGRDEERRQNAMQLSETVVKHLVREVLQDGAVPLVVYLPYKREIAPSTERQLQNLPPVSARMLQNANIKYFDPTTCLTEVRISEAYMKGNHYSPQASAQIARCLAPALRKILNDA